MYMIEIEPLDVSRKSALSGLKYKRNSARPVNMR